MGADTKAIINGANGFEDITNYLKPRFEDFKIHNTSSPGFIQCTFKTENGKRMMNIFDQHYSKDYGRSDGYIVSLGNNEEAIKIIEDMTEVFGGWFCENDCAGTWTEKKGHFCEGDGIPYFYRYGIINGTIENCDDFAGMRHTIDVWEKEINHTSKINF